MLALRVESSTNFLSLADFRRKLLDSAAAPFVQLVVSWISPPFRLLPVTFSIDFHSSLLLHEDLPAEFYTDYITFTIPARDLISSSQT